MFEETSAISVVGVREAFENLLQEIFNTKGMSSKTKRGNETNRIYLPKFNITKRGCCE